MDIRDAELASLERKRGGKAKKRKRKAEDDVATSFKEANAGALPYTVVHCHTILPRDGVFLTCPAVCTGSSFGPQVSYGIMALRLLTGSLQRNGLLSRLLKLS